MLDIAIVGAGLCGLSLARQLHKVGREFAVFEARPRAGGRALTRTCVQTGAPIDLGPTWFWPQTEPRITALLDTLGIGSFPQHDSGAVLHLDDPNRGPQALAVAGVHGGARRIDGGAGRLVAALLAGLPPDALHFEARLDSLAWADDGVELRVESGGALRRIRARRVVLAVPPRVLSEHVKFEPALDAALLDAMRDTPTWMAAQSKVVVRYPSSFWRDAGQAGNAFVEHPQAMLREVFDACDALGAAPALGGFVALPARLRDSFRVGMPMLIASQLVQLFGPAAEAGDADMHWHDWARDPETCSTRDRNENAPPSGAAGGHPILRQAHWRQRIFFAGTETASHGACHMEGALDAAARVARALGIAAAPASVRETTMPALDVALEDFAAWVADARGGAAARYRVHLTRLLSTQQHEQLTQRALLATVEQIYSEALGRLEALVPHAHAASVVDGRSELTPVALAPFKGMSKALLNAALQFNRESCAISNFPDQHDPSPAHIDAAGRDLAAAWREFALTVNELLLAHHAFCVAPTV